MFVHQDLCVDGLLYWRRSGGDIYTAYAFNVASSETTFPPFNFIILPVLFAKSKSCVTKIKVVPASLFKLKINSIIFSLVSASRLPVGSSAKSICGLLLKA